MAKTNATRRSGRQSQVVPIKDVDKAENVKTQKETPIITSDKPVNSTEEAPIESAETEKCEDSQMDIVAGSTATVTVTLEKNKEKESDEVQKETNGGEPVKMTPGKGKRKASSSVETSLPKKTKPLNDGYCLYVGNLNNSKTVDEVKDSLTNHFMTHSLPFQLIRLDRSKKYAFVDFASEMDLTKGLSLNGKMMHDKPMKVAKAKVKSKDPVQVKAPAKKKKKSGNKRRAGKQKDAVKEVENKV